MSLEKEINDGIKAAMLAKEKVRLAGLRAVKAEILLAKTADGSDEISDARSRPPFIRRTTDRNWPKTNWPRRPCWKCLCRNN